MYYDFRSASIAAQRLADESDAPVMIMGDKHSPGYYEIAHYNECKDLYTVDWVYPDPGE